MADDTYGSITEEGLAELRDRIGVEIDEPEPHVREATLDTIRHWAYGIGCDDPLYTDPAYAEDGPYGELVAPPTFLYATSRIASGYVGGLPGVHAMYAGTDWEWHEPIRRDTTITASSRLSDLVERETDFSGRSIQQIYTTEFRDGSGTLLAEADSWCFRTERDAASRDRRKYERESVEPADWDESDLDRFAEHYRRETPRGGEPRYVESVSVGDELDTLLKGPLSVTNVVAFDQGWGGLYLRAHRRLFDLFDDHPALRIPNGRGVPEPPEKVHWDDEFAREVGVPLAYDYGPERVSWLGHVVHHWMGDRGRLRSLYGEVRRHNLIGDVTRCSGEVVDVYREGGENLVDVELEARDHRGNPTATGEATVALPSEDE